MLPPLPDLHLNQSSNKPTSWSQLTRQYTDQLHNDMLSSRLESRLEDRVLDQTYRVRNFGLAAPRPSQWSRGSQFK